MSLTERFRRLWPLLVVLVAGVLARTALVPITHGPDFTVWDLASRATLKGVNVYAHHPAYSGGPYTYFPLFLYIELPMQWLALHTGVSFTIYGKLPIVVADLAATLLIVREMRRHGSGVRAQAVGAALFFLNPLVLYNGAFYGRFDSVAVALLMAALSLRGQHGRQRLALLICVCPLGRGEDVPAVPVAVAGTPRAQRCAAGGLEPSAAVLAAISLPYLLTSASAFVDDLLYSAGKLPGGMSWQVVMHGLPATVQVDVGDVLLGAFVVAAVLVAFAFADDLTVAAAATIVLFLLLSKQVIEQYLLWPLPFLVLLATGRGSRSAWLLVAELTTAGMLVNAYYHPFGVQPAAVNVVFAAGVTATLARLIATEHGRHGAPRVPDGAAAETAAARAVAVSGS